MSISVKIEKIVKGSGEILKGIKLYRSEISRADCEASEEAFKELDVDATEYVDTEVKINKLYWYRVDLVVDEYVVKGNVQVAKYSANAGLLDPNPRLGDIEYGLAAVTYNTVTENSIPFAALMMEIYRKNGIVPVTSASFTSGVNSSRIGLYIDGQQCYLTTDYTSYTGNAGAILMSIIDNGNYTFESAGHTWKIDVLTSTELYKLRDSIRNGITVEQSSRFSQGATRSSASVSTTVGLKVITPGTPNEEGVAQDVINWSTNALNDSADEWFTGTPGTTLVAPASNSTVAVLVRLLD